MIERILYLKKNELWILLRRAGVSRIVFFEGLKTSQIDDHEVAVAITGLISRGLIEGGEDGFRVTEKMRPYIRVLSSARHSIVERRMMDTYPVSCVFLSSDKVLRITMDNESDGKVGLRLYDLEDFLDEEFSYEFMPANNSELTEGCEEDIPDLSEWEENFADDPDLLLYYRIYNVGSCELIKRVFVKRLSLLDIIAFEENGETEVTGYSRNRLSDLICTRQT